MGAVLYLSDVPKMPHDDEDGKEDEDMEDPDVRLQRMLRFRVNDCL